MMLVVLPTAIASPARGASRSRVSARNFHRRAPERASGISLTPSTTRPYWACPEGLCEAIIDPTSAQASHRWALPAGGPLLEGSGEKGGYDPQDLQSAYKIPTAGGSTQTIALVDAYGDKTAESDLAKYRERYGLAACTRANGCFRKLNQKGEEANYPAAQKGWEGETSVDLDMASAACPGCHILLVEATQASFVDLAEAVNLAASSKFDATEISNSYGAAEEACGAAHCEEYDVDYDHPGVEVVASAGDSGYDDHYEGYASPSFPSTSPNVLAVGGTSLRKAPGARGWAEEVWNEPARELGTGSGCSLSEPKPAWQTDKGCAKRTGNDVAAVAACETPVSVYSAAYGGWEDFCGTSVSAPLVTGILAHASEHTRSLGARAFYEDRDTLFSVAKGSNGTCSLEYLCDAEKQEDGYDGPAGVGTPDGPPSPAPTVTGLLPNAGPPSGGTTVAITGTNFANVTEVRFGSTKATSFTVNSETSISAVAPVGTGAVEVTVSTGAGESSAGEADRFSYGVPPTYAGAVEAGGIPGGLALDAEGHIWVAEWYEDVLDELGEQGELIRQIGTLESPCTGDLEGPFGVAIDAKGNVWVTDSLHDRVLKLSSAGKCELQVGTEGEGDGQFSYPTGVAVGPDGHVWVTDTGNARVQELGENGEYLGQFGAFGSGHGQFEWPLGVAVDSQGHVWVADMLADRVQELGQSGEYLGQLPARLPSAVALDSHGNVWVPEFGGGAVAEFNANREALTAFGSEGSGEGQFRWPGDVAVEPGGNLWLSDEGGRRIEKWTGAS
jgi:DNA-binding beta-propeller fold protein YncE